MISDKGKLNLKDIGLTHQPVLPGRTSQTTVTALQDQRYTADTQLRPLKDFTSRGSPWVV